MKPFKAGSLTHHGSGGGGTNAFATDPTFGVMTKSQSVGGHELAQLIAARSMSAPRMGKDGDAEDGGEISMKDAKVVLARFRGVHGDGLLDSLRLRFAMFAIDLSEYEQRVVLGGELRIGRVDLTECAKNICRYSKFERLKCETMLTRLDREDLSYWSRPHILLQVLYHVAIADHRRKADHSLKRAWDLLHLFLILFFFCASTYVNVLNLDWDYDAQARGLVDAYYAITVFFIIDIVFTTQLATLDGSRVIAEPWEIIARKKAVLFIDVVAALPFDFILQSAGAWIPFMVFRCAKYIKIVRAVYLFEIVNTSIVTKGRLRFFYELKPLILGTYWVIILMQVSAVLHSMADIYVGDEVTGERHWPYFIQSYIVVSAAFIGSPASILCYNDWERANVVLLMLGTLVFQGAVISKFSTLLLSASVASENLTHLRKTVSMMNHYQFPPSVQRSVLSFLSHSLEDHASLHTKRLDSLPDNLFEEVVAYSRLSAVKQVPLFAHMSGESHERLSRYLVQNIFRSEQNLVTIGEEGNEMYMITFGYVEVVIGTGAIVANLTQGDFFGELALFSANGKRMATVRALTFVDSWSLSRQHFIEVCALSEEFRKKITDEVKKRGFPIEEFDRAVDDEKKRLEEERRTAAGEDDVGGGDGAAEQSSEETLPRVPAASTRRHMSVFAHSTAPHGESIDHFLLAAPVQGSANALISTQRMVADLQITNAAIRHAVDEFIQGRAIIERAMSNNKQQ